jgi:succinoglycan biosynthesis protein ExoA
MVWMFSLNQKFKAVHGRLPYRRQLTFGVIGVSVMVASYLSLIFLISVLGVAYWLAYLFQAILAIELNFTLNNLITWRDRPARDSKELLKRLLKFNLTRWALTVPFNWLLFTGLVRVGVPYLFANTICIGLTTVFNYFVGDKLVFTPYKEAVAPSSHAPPGQSGITRLASVSVVIPVKQSHRTIRQTVDSLLAQDYPGDVEIILVGDYEDSTWSPLQDLIQERRVTAIGTEITGSGRDANAKRNLGLQRVTGTVIALTDSDMVLPPDWISTGVTLMEEGWDCVAGPMRSVSRGFWGEYVDKNRLGSKTPRMDEDYVLTRENFGKDGLKPPITANVFVSRRLLDRVGELDPHFVFTYEDYEWFRRVADAGLAMLCTGRLTADHYHRQGFRDLIREYHRGGRGCGDYIYKHPHCRFGKNRLRYLTASYMMVGAGSCLVAASVFFPITGIVLLAGGGALGLYSAWQTRLVSGVVYPFITFTLGLAFTAGLTRRLLKGRHLPDKTQIVSSGHLVPEIAHSLEEQS